MEVIATGLGLTIFQLFDRVRLGLKPAVATPDAASVEMPSLPETLHSKPGLFKCQPVRWSADVADTPSDLTSSAVVPVTLPAGGCTAPTAGQPTPLLTVLYGLYRQSVGMAEYRHAKAIGSGSLAHRAGRVAASSMTMRPSESLRFATETHRHLSPVREAGYASQPRRRSATLAESHQMKACASQDDS